MATAGSLVQLSLSIHQVFPRGQERIQQLVSTFTPGPCQRWHYTTILNSKILAATLVVMWMHQVINLLVVNLQRSSLDSILVLRVMRQLYKQCCHQPGKHAHALLGTLVLQQRIGFTTAGLAICYDGAIHAHQTSTKNRQAHAHEDVRLCRTAIEHSIIADLALLSASNHFWIAVHALRHFSRYLCCGVTRRLNASGKLSLLGIQRWSHAHKNLRSRLWTRIRLLCHAQLFTSN
jgi:hypothetical protein